MNRASRYLANVTLLAFVRVVVVAFCVGLCHYATPSDGKVFDRCELAQLLRYGHGLDVNDVANWVCIAQHSSSLNTSAFGGNARSGSHGIFQISDQYWCSPPGKGVACGLTCDRLRDDDISDDLACVQVIHQEHQRLSGDGYNAWVAYQQYCRDNPYEYVEDCFGNEEQEYLHAKSITANSVQYNDDEEEEEFGYSKKRGKVYKRCELAKELFLRHKMPMEEIPTWVCIAQHESNYDTAAVGRLNTDGSADHGLFQISDLYWCSHKGGRRKACGLPCSKLLDSDISDDMKCVKQIFQEHTRISGDGFTAWTVYNAYCQGTTESYIRGCFDGIDVVSESKVFEEYKKPSKPSKLEKKKPHGKVYEPCELAEELRTKHRLPEDQIATWVCIAKHESDYNTSAIGYGDHGLFQISDIYWCSPPGKGWACGLSCEDLEDSDISDDVECIRKIYNEHTHLSGDGFNAWTVYPQYCSDGKSDKYISHCPGAGRRPAVTSPPHTHSKQISANSIEDYEPKSGKIYGRCELANELLTKYEMSMEEVPTWVCIAHHESNFDTSAVGRRNTDGSADHGLFQISDIYWCSHKDGHRKACGLPCSKLLDDDITDDMRCVKQIYDEHTRISGDGFTAWTVYDAYCKDRTEQYVQGCFDGSALPEDFKPAPRIVDHGYIPKNKPKGKVYEECELAKELRDKHRMPKEQIATWVCIAKQQSGLNTSSSLSNVHGLFHISDEFWCSPPGKGQVCELHCSDLEDSDISDDIECVRKIYLEHQRLFGDGFSAWVVYPQYCSDGKADGYISHCPGFKTTTANAIPYGFQNGVIKVHPKLGGGSIEVSNKPVYNHVFEANPFLKHFETVNSYPAPTIYSEQPEQYSSASEEVAEVVPASHAYNLNPFLKRIPSEEEKQTEAPIKTINALPPSFHGIPIAPTPTRPNSALTYQPENEEKAKYEVFKALATPSLPPITQTPKANRLQTYQLNTFKTLHTPTVTTPSLTTNRLQPYQVNTFKSFGLATPTFQSLSTKSSTIKPTLPTVRSSAKPITSTTTKAPQASKDIGQYNAGKYDYGRYDSGRYDSGKYSQLKKQPPASSTITNANLGAEEKSSAQSSGQYPGPTSTLQSKTTTGIRITSTNQNLEKPVIAATKISAQPTTTKLPASSSNFGQYKPYTPTFTAKSPSSNPIIVPKSTSKLDPFRPFSTVRPITTNTATPSVGQYVQPSAIRHSGQYIAYKKPAPPSPVLTAYSEIRTTQPTKKFDPFKPYATGSYDPYKVFNTSKQKPSSPFTFLSGKEASGNELDFAPSSNSKRETVSSLRGDLRTSSTIKRETTSNGAKPTQSGAESKQKSALTATISKTTSTPQVTATPARQSSKLVTTFNRSIKSTPASPVKSLKSSGISTPTSSVSKSDTTISPTRAVETQKFSPTKASGILTTTRSAPGSRSTATISPTRAAETLKYSPIRSSVTTRSVAATTPTRSVPTQKPSQTKASGIAAPTRSVPSSTSAASISPTRAAQKSSPTRSPGISVTTRSVAATTPTRSLVIQKPSPTKSPGISTPTRSVPASRSAATISPTRSVVTQKPSPTRSPGISITTRSVSSSRSVPPTTSTISDARSPSSTTSTRAATVTKPLSPNAAIRPITPITAKPIINSAPPTRSTVTFRKTRSLSPSSTIRTTSTTISPQHVFPTRTAFQESSTPKLILKTTTTGTTTRSTATSAIHTSKTTQIRPTKSQHSSDILFSTKLYDLYYKLYGVHLHPPMETSSGVQQVTKTSQTNVVPSRTS